MVHGNAATTARDGDDEMDNAANKVTIDRELADFCYAYLLGNEAARESNGGAYQIADQLGFDRGTKRWDAAVAGAAAFLLSGHTFEAGASALAAKLAA